MHLSAHLKLINKLFLILEPLTPLLKCSQVQNVVMLEFRNIRLLKSALTVSGRQQCSNPQYKKSIKAETVADVVQPFIVQMMSFGDSNIQG